MTVSQDFLFGVAIGAIPTAELGRILIAALAKRAGVTPKEIVAFNDATDDE